MRNQNPKNLIMNLAEAKPKMRYDGSVSFDDWQRSARNKLSELLGLDLIPRCEDEFEILSVADCGDYTDTGFSFQSENGYFVPCHFLKPKKIEGRLPVLICLQGHSTGMHISLGQAIYDGDEDVIKNGDRDYARLAVKRGYCAVAIEQRYMGQCGGTDKGTGCLHRPENGVNALPTLLFGRTAIGERVHDVMRAIDVICNTGYRVFDCIDVNDIMLTGNSGGGTTTFYTSCIDERVKYSVPSCAFCTYKNSIIDLSHCACNYIPSAARYFDMGDLAGLIAPRGLIIAAGKDDKIFPLQGVKESFEIAEKLFACAKCSDKIKLVIGNGGHRYYAEETFEILEEMRGLSYEKR